MLDRPRTVEGMVPNGEGGVAPIYPSDGEGVLFSYKFVRTLLALTSKVAVGELVAIEVLMYTTI